MENNIHTLMNEIIRIKEEFVKRKLYLYNKLGAVQKELSNIDKLLEFKTLSNDEVLELTKKRKNLLLLRRVVKEELKYFEEVDKDNQFSYNALGYYIKTYSNAKESISEIATKSISYYSSGIETIKRVDIENFNEKKIEETIQELSKNFEKVFIDIEEKTIKAYNKCRVI